MSISLGSGQSKVILQAGSEDVLLAYDENNFNTDNYFTLQAGTSIILDQPVPQQSQLVYAITLAGTAVLEVWIT